MVRLCPLAHGSKPLPLSFLAIRLEPSGVFKMNAKKQARRERAAKRFKILPFYDWANRFGGVGDVPDNHEEQYAAYVARKNVEKQALGL